MPKRLARHFPSLLILILAGSVVQAQDGLKETFIRAQEQNRAQLRNYSWTRRTEIKVKGESKDVRTESVRYDSSGQLQKTPLNNPPAKPVDKGKQKEQDKKKGEFTAFLKSLSDLAQPYTQLTPDQVEALAKGAAISKEQGTVQFKANYVVLKGDSVTLTLDGSTFLMKQASIGTIYLDDPITLTVAYEMLPDGTSYPKRVDLSYPKKETQVILENSGYQLLPEAAAAAQAPVDEGWPRRTVKDGAALITYQPQVDEWKDFKTLTWRMAVNLTPRGGKAAIGALSIEALTDVDNEKHTVLIHDLKVQRVNFPSLEKDAAAAAQMDQLVRTFLPPTVTISLERIVASTPKKESAPTVQLKNDPPRIFVSYKPAILLDVDGEPVNVPIRETSLEYVLNTSRWLFRDKTDSHYYFLAGDQWMTATDLKGPWAAARELPKDMNTAANDEHFQGLKDFVPLRPPKAGATIPEVFYTTGPAEVILFDGTPAYTAIPGTQLSYATNTISYVFSSAATKQVYYLTTGRWFSANSFDGPWAYATPSLPEDFSRIPESSPASQVLTSVPGTEQAKDSVLMAQIPTTAVVNPEAAAAGAKVTYDGEPKFAHIEGTSLEYATNTGEKVIRLGDVYYLCFQAVWFTAATPNGPWTTASTVPAEIYLIPPNSPLHNVTYVTQKTLPSGDVEASYTSGYEGAFVVGVSVGMVVYGGTGYYYPYVPYYYPGYYGYPYYYPYPYTYGAAAYYNGAGRYGVAQVAYGPYGAAARGASYNPYTGTATRSAAVATPYGSAFAGRAYNPYTGAAAATRQGSNAYSQWGSSVVSKNGQSAYTQHYSNSRGTVGSIQGSQGGAAIGAVGRGGNSGFAGKTAGGDMYAGHDGNLYRNTGSGWQKYDSGSWNPADTASARQSAQSRAQSGTAAQRGSVQNSSSQTQALRNEAQSRQRGAQSSQQFQQRSFGGGGGGGFRGGGGGRRR
jgi:hypothetical protein